MIDPITLQTAVRKNVTDALAEDIGTGDLSASLIPASEKTQANVITRDNGLFLRSALGRRDHGPNR